MQYKTSKLLALHKLRNWLAADMSLQRFMVDIETLSQDTDAVISTIGCVAFSLNRIGSTSMFYTRVSIESCHAIGLRMDPATVLWWMDQPDAARREITSRDGLATIYTALQGLSDFIKSESQGREIRMYAKDPDFDCVILRTAYKRTHIECPWDYWQTRSVRTTLEDNGYTKKLKAKHHALNDALLQVQAVQEALNPDLFITQEAASGIAQ